jgi:hypothetical protein
MGEGRRHVIWHLVDEFAYWSTQVGMVVGTLLWSVFVVAPPRDQLTYWKGWAAVIGGLVVAPVASLAVAALIWRWM